MDFPIQSPTELGKLIRRTRKEAGLTLEQCAGVNGVGVRFLSELERGKPTVELGLALRITRSLGIVLSASLPEI